MLTASGAYALTVAGNAMTVDCRVTLGVSLGDVTAWVESISLEETLTTEAPEGVRAPTGTAAASGTVVLGGATIVDALNPYNTSSVFYRSTLEGTSVLIDYGLDGELLRKLTGVIDSYDVDAAAGTVTLHVVDNRARARQPIQLPTFSARQITAAYSYTNAPGLAAGYVADHLARLAGFHSCPEPRANGVVFASMHGSLYPEIIAGLGAQRYFSLASGTWAARETFSMVAGKWGQQVPPNAAGAAGLRSCGAFMTATGGANRGIYMGFWIYIGTATAADTEIAWCSMNGVGSEFAQMSVMQNGGNVRIRMRGGRSGYAYADRTSATALSIGWHHVAARFQFLAASPTFAQEQAWIDGTAGTPASVSIGALSGSSTGEAASAGWSAVGPIESLQITGEAAGTPAADMAFTPTAYLDATPETLDVVPAVPADADPWTLLQEFAAAVQGAVRFDENGVLRFLSRATLRGSAAVRAISADSSLKALTQGISAAAKANRVRVPLATYTPDGTGYAWSADSAMSLEPKETRTWRIRTDDVMVPYPFDSLAPNYTVFPSATTGDFRLSTTADGAGSTLAPDSSALPASIRIVSPNEFLLTLTNVYSVKVWLVAPAGDPVYQAGDPVLRLSGSRLAEDSNGLVVESVMGAGDRVLTVGANRFAQNATAQMRADDLLVDLYVTRNLWEGVRIVPDARLQLADRVTLTDPDVNRMVIEDGRIVGVRTELDGEKWEQELDVRAVAAPGAWLLGVVGRGEIGLTNYL